MGHSSPLKATYSQTSLFKWGRSSSVSQFLTMLCSRSLYKILIFWMVEILNDYIFLKDSPEMYLSSVRNWINIRFGFDDSFLLFVIPEMGKWQRDWCCDHQRSRWQSFLCRWRHQRWAAACRFNHWSLCSFSLCLSCRGLLVTEVTNSFSKG